MRKVFLILFLLFGLSNFLFAEELIEYDYELDVYYTNVSAYIDLDTEEDLTDGSKMEEKELYKYLFRNSLASNVFLMEFAVHPMNLAGLQYRKHNEDLYTVQNRENFNIVKSMTAGFEEPYALSFFLGRMMVFKKKNTSRAGNNRAYIGYLVTVGDQTIKDNRSYDNKWLVFEVKLKGTRDKQNSDLDWSFRLGTRMQQREEFVDTIYIGARRKRIDYNKGLFSLVYNTAYTTTLSVSSETLEITEAELIIDKFFPTGHKGLSLGFGIGYLYTSENKYLGSLKDDGIDNHQIIFRPNFKYKF